MNNMTFDFDDSKQSGAKLKVVGVGGAGGNAINRMISEGLHGVEFIGVNTDEQALNMCKAPCKVYVGTKSTQGLGAGADPDKGRRAVEEDRNSVYDYLSDADMVFITAGMGGGTGTGASPIVAEIARDIGALTVGIVTTPFIFEGPKRIQRAEEGIQELKERVDTLIVIPNQRLLTIVPKNTPLDTGFRYADEILFNATKGISDLITIPGLVNLDFADVRTVMSEMGDALMGCGAATGEDRARVAAYQAINSPLLEDVNISGALGVLVNITGGQDMSLHEVSEAAGIISEEAGTKANIIFGSVIDKNLDDEIRITVIATGLASQRGKMRFGSHAGINRPRFNATPNTQVNKREIPAIDRMEEINDEVNKNSNIDINTINKNVKPAQFDSKPQPQAQPRPRQEFRPENRPEPRQEPRREPRQDVRPERHTENRQEPRSEHRTENTQPFKSEFGPKPEPEQDYNNGYFSMSQNKNGHAEDDIDVPACRRKKWGMFGMD